MAYDIVLPALMGLGTISTVIRTELIDICFVWYYSWQSVEARSVYCWVHDICIWMASQIARNTRWEQPKTQLKCRTFSNIWGGRDEVNIDGKNYDTQMVFQYSAILKIWRTDWHKQV
jgi:hypothetical protein